MTFENLEVGPLQADELQALEAVLQQSLHTHYDAGWLKYVGFENFLAARQNGKVVGGIGIMRMGQWFGGQRVPSAGITAVGVSPEHRGRGTASFFLKRMLETLHDEDIPLSVLFPTTLPVYRRAGYERAGVRITYELPVREIFVRERELDIAPAEPHEREEIYQLYATRGRLSAGNLDRSPLLWNAILGAEGREVFTYLITRGGIAEGYVVYQQARRADHIRIRDVCVMTRGAGERLLTFLADHRAIIESVSWNGGPNDPLAHLLTEEEARATRINDWLLRIVDVESALAQRGYPIGLDATLHFEVEDDVLPWNNGRFVLEVANGQGSVRKGGDGTFRVDVRGLASMYTGHLAPSELRVIGGIDGTERELGIASLVFSGPRPWMPDRI